jgi:hypothetical protein
VFERGASAKKANAMLLAMIDPGFSAVHEIEVASRRSR